MVYIDTGECVLYVPHAANDPRPFDPSVVAIQVTTAAGPRRLTYVDDGTACPVQDSAGMLSWYFVNWPPHIVFCPGACKVIQVEASDIVEVLLACTTLCPPP